MCDLYVKVSASLNKDKFVFNFTCYTQALYEELCLLANVFELILDLVWHCIDQFCFFPLYCPNALTLHGLGSLMMTYVMTQLAHWSLSGEMKNIDDDPG